MANRGGAAETLNEGQQRRLLVTCRHIDGMLSEVEAVLNQSASKSAFPRYVSDIPASRRHTIEDYIARIRAQLKRVLEGQGIALPQPSISASHAAYVSLQFIDISVEELKPRYMRGYGEVPPNVSIELNGIVGELQGLISKLNQYLLRGGEDLEQRLKRLEATGDDLELLGKLQQMIVRHGLVEFRSTVSAILDRIEDKAFEIAVFGRVSSGKSSLLNAMLETDVLPVGVTPITAVPTRIVHGEQPLVRVWFPEKPEERFDVSRLAEFVAEQQNPGNTKHVSRIVVELPAPHLREGIAFVDTPGLGSLATSAAAETLAYLPRCDLGVVLIDAGSTLSPEDLRTIQALYDAAIPATVLLSKADLLKPDDLARILEYVKTHITSELQTNVPVHPVSVRPGFAHLLSSWFEADIEPLQARRQELKQKSIRRKVGSLRHSVEAVLRSRLRRSTMLSERHTVELKEVEDRLRRATGKLQETTDTALRLAEEVRDLGQPAIQEAARDLATAGATNGAEEIRAAISKLVKQWTGALLNLLENSARDITRDLETAAQVLEISDKPAHGEFASLLREMPVLELDELSLQVSRPTLASILGRRFAMRTLARRMEEQAGGQLSRCLKRYSELLKEWTNTVKGGIHRRFDAYADTYRAQLGRMLGGGDADVNEEAIRHDLAELSAAPPESELPVARIEVGGE